MLYICAIIFVLAASILESGLDLRTLPSCRAAIYLCLVFYVGCKVCVQLFLTERAHAARYMIKRRCKDWLWYVATDWSLTMIFANGVTLGSLASLSSLSDLAQSQ